MTILTILVFILIFSLLILVHECGHFFAAKMSGVEVEEFGMGLPPRLFGIKKGKTLYSLNLIPFGGFVRLLGENGTVNKKVAKGAFGSKSLLKRAFIICAGVIMNFLLAFLLLTIGFIVGIEPLIIDRDDLLKELDAGKVLVEFRSDLSEENSKEQPLIFLPRLRVADDLGGISPMRQNDVILQINGKEIFTEKDLNVFSDSSIADFQIFRESEGVLNFQMASLPDVQELESELQSLISYVEDESPADKSGLLAGDIILSVDEVQFPQPEDIAALNMASSDDGSVIYKLARNGEELIFEIPVQKNGRVGIGLSRPLSGIPGFTLYEDPMPHTLLDIVPVKAGLYSPVLAVTEMWRLSKSTAIMFFGVIIDFVSFQDLPAEVSGPVGIAQMTGVFMQDGFAAVLRFVALLSLSLGVVNILPIPALDGGRLLFLAIEAVTGRKPKPALEQLIHSGGFFLLITLIVYVTIQDILNLL